MTLKRATIPMCPECDSGMAAMRTGVVYQCMICPCVTKYPNWGYRDESAESRAELARAKEDDFSKGSRILLLMAERDQANARLEAIAKEARLLPANTPGMIELRDRLLELAEGGDS